MLKILKLKTDDIIDSLMRLASIFIGYTRWKLACELQEMYQMITLGGDAELELVDTLDPFNEGIHFSVRPPKKSPALSFKPLKPSRCVKIRGWKQITNLSGGEKTLASLSLVFALHHYRHGRIDYHITQRFRLSLKSHGCRPWRPTPLYFMDEIDAALDFRNARSLKKIDDVQVVLVRCRSSPTTSRWFVSFII